MENHPHESIDTVFNCVIPYIQNGNDRNSVSLVCRKWYELDCMTRKLLTVHLPYSPAPSRLHQRFPSIESLTLKGVSFGFKSDITPWVQEISGSYKCLKALHISCVVIRDSDLELLAKTRGKDLWVLKIYKCKGFSTDGLLHIGKYCNDLKTLCLKGNSLDEKDDLTSLAKSCSQSLVFLKIPSCDLVDVFSYDVRLEEFYGDGEFVFSLPPRTRSLGLEFLTKSMFPFVLPFAHQLRELDLSNVLFNVDRQCFFVQRCPNLEVLYTGIGLEDMGLQVISQFCKKLRKLKISGYRSHMGLISLAQGCVDLEVLHINLDDITNEAMKCIGTHLKNLHNFQMNLREVAEKITIPQDKGVRLMLIGCSKLERLCIHLCSGGLTDVGLGYIGKYGQHWNRF
ncbi:coronatine-insensitive protein 1-like protein [Tanacetum coccineum]